VSPRTSIRFLIPRVTREADGKLEITADSVAATVSGGEEGTQPVIVRVDPGGIEAILQVGPEDLRCVHFMVRDGQVVWEPAGDPDGSGRAGPDDEQPAEDTE
jgi:hypothetical protein